VAPAPFTAGRARCGARTFSTRGRHVAVRLAALALLILATFVTPARVGAQTDCCECGTLPGPVTCGPAIEGAC